jgi:hypothetical protein
MAVERRNRGFVVAGLVAAQTSTLSVSEKHNL